MNPSSEHPPAEGASSEPVAITKESSELMANPGEKIPAGLPAESAAKSDIWISPLCDESVQGYATDEGAKRNGLVEIKEVTDKIRSAGISCCLVGEGALIYYGTGRVLHVIGPFHSRE